MSEVVTWLLPPFAVLAVGGVFLPTQWLFLAAAVLMVVGEATYRERGSYVLTGAVAAALLGVLWQLLSLVPLPLEMLASISPSTAGFVTAASEAAAVPIPSHPLSLSPGDTALSTARLAFFAAVLLGASLVARRDAVGRLTTSVVITAALTLLVVLVHALLGHTAIYGIVPAGGRGISAVLGPFINSNHLAAFCCIALPPTVTWAAMRSGRLRQVGMLLAFLLAVTALVTVSRSAVLGLWVGGFVLGAGMWMAGIPVWRRILVVLLGAGGALGLALALSARLRIVLLPDVLFNVDGRVRLWADAWSLIGEHRLTGVGAGAFETVWWSFRSGPSERRAQDAESLYVQTLASLGMPATVVLAVVALVVFGLLAWWAVESARKRCFEPLGALAGLCAFGVIDGFTLSSSQPGILVVVAYLIAAAGADSHGGLRSHRLTSAALGVLLIGVGFATLSWGESRSLIADDAWFQERLKNDALAEGDDPIEHALRHPADPFGFAWTAHLQRRDWRGRSPYLMNRAMLLDPHGAEPHRVAAAVLLQRGLLDQARTEAMLALSVASKPEIERFVRDALAIWTTPDQRVALLPRDPDRAVLVGMQIEAQAGPEVARAVWRTLAQRNPVVLPALAHVVRLAAPSERADAFVMVESALVHQPDHGGLQLLAGQLMLWSGRESEGTEVLIGLLSGVELLSDWERGAALVQLGRQVPDSPAGMAPLLGLPSAGGNTEEAARSWLRGRTREHEGQMSRAIADYAEAASLRPDSVFYRQQLVAARARTTESR